MNDVKKSITEAKVKAGALMALAVGLIGQGLLAGTVTDYVPALPDFVEVPAYSLIASALVWIAGFVRSSVAGKLAPSTVAAVEAELHNRGL